MRPGRVPRAGHHRLPARGPPPQARLRGRQPGRPRPGGGRHRPVRGGGGLRRHRPRPLQRGRGVRRRQGPRDLPQAAVAQLRRFRRAAILRGRQRTVPAVRDRWGAGGRRRLRGRVVSRRSHLRPVGGRGGADRQPQRVPLPRRPPGRAGAHARHPRPRLVVLAGLREPGRRPGRARLRRGLVGARPPGPGGGPGRPVRRGHRGGRRRGQARLPQTPARPPGTGHGGAPAGGDGEPGAAGDRSQGHRGGRGRGRWASAGRAPGPDPRDLPGPRPRDPGLRDQERFHRRGDRPVGGRRLVPRGHHRGRRPRPRPRPRGDDAVALLEREAPSPTPRSWPRTWASSGG